ncbi:uncharacterized protein LOC111332002 [Stylophora pistillata]|uniref:uncharacterized protein LOC111332002 n=1 Tax=Stylophora pistillata TaxID=50429 RepID=UPI000C03E917|nr:uncharacterized protein LOC111332002 [Stylophora pistillata]
MQGLKPKENILMSDLFAMKTFNTLLIVFVLYCLISRTNPKAIRKGHQKELSSNTFLRQLSMDNTEQKRLLACEDVRDPYHCFYLAVVEDNCDQPGGNLCSYSCGLC